MACDIPNTLGVPGKLVAAGKSDHMLVLVEVVSVLIGRFHSLPESDRRPWFEDISTHMYNQWKGKLP